MKRVLTVTIFLLFNLLSAQEPIVTATVVDQNMHIEAGSEFDLQINLDIKDHWHINSSQVLDDYSIPTKISIEDENFTLLSVDYPAGKVIPISWGGNMSLYEGNVSFTAKFITDKTLFLGVHNLKIKIAYQACNNATCMSPENIIITAKLIVVEPVHMMIMNSLDSNPETDSDQVKKSNISENVAVSNEQNTDTDPFQNKNILMILLLVFAMGLALNLTPCVYPLIPITMGYFLAQKESKSPVLLAIMYVLGLAITYSIIGTLAAFGGAMMGSLLAHPATLIFFAVLMFALSLSMFGLYEFRLPGGLTQMGGGSRSGALGALIMGLTMGIVAAPCVGPFVVSLLSFVAKSGSVFVGFITFFVLALGLGIPYLLLGIFSNKISSLPRSGEWLNGIKVFFGLALIGMSIYFILPLLSGKIAEYILPVYMIAAAVYYGVINGAGLSVKWFSRLKAILAMLVLAFGIIMIKPSSVESEDLLWETYSKSTLERSIESDKPVIIDFYADWCNPCKELEHITFADADVAEVLEDFIRIKVDLTVGNDSTNAIKERYDIPGVPTILFYDKQGVERKDLRLNGFEKPDKFLKRLRNLNTDNQ